MLYFLVPAFNEESNIQELLTSLLLAADSMGGGRVIVVDDGSADRTASTVRSFRAPANFVSLVSHTANRGPGAAFQTAFTEALERAGPQDVLVTLEADNTSDLRILPAMLASLSDGNDVVVASYYAESGGIEGVSLWRLVLSSSASRLMRWLFPIPGVRTYTSFFRAYTVKAVRRLSDCYDGVIVSEAGFSCAAEVLLKSRRAGLRIGEVPMVLNAALRRDPSKMRVGSNIMAHIRLIGAECLSTRPRNRRG